MLLVDTSKSCNSGCLFGGATCRRQYELVVLETLTVAWLYLTLEH